MRVSISSHAYEQWKKRVNPHSRIGQVRAIVSRRLKNELQKGMAVERTASPLPICPYLRAIVKPEKDYRGWVVVTFIATASPNKLNPR